VVRPCLEAIKQSHQVLVAVLCLGLGGLAVDADCAILARAPIGFLQERYVNVMRERGQLTPGDFFRQCRYPVKFR
jgi:hypothetical protein